MKRKLILVALLFELSDITSIAQAEAHKDGNGVQESTVVFA